MINNELIEKYKPQNMNHKQNEIYDLVMQYAEKNYGNLGYISHIMSFNEKTIFVWIIRKLGSGFEMPIETDKFIRYYEKYDRKIKIKNILK